MAEQATLDIQFSKRFSANLISNIVYFILNLIIGLALTPFFLDTLGQSAYGLIPLATSITSYVTLVIDAINGSVLRFLTVDLQKGDIVSANKTFNTAVFGTIAIIVILIPIALIISFFAPSFFNIGNQSYFDVFILFAFVFASVLIRTYSSNFMTTLFSKNRLDYRNYINITNLIVQVIFVVILFSLLGASLPLVGLSYLIASISAFILAFILSRKTCPELIVNIRQFERSKFKEISVFAFWSCFVTLGTLLYSQIGLVVVNKLFGDIAGTEYALCLMWVTLLVTVSGLITNTFMPMIFSYYAKGDRDGMLLFTKKATKIVGLFMVLPIGLICIFMPQLMTIWVGAEYAALTPIIWILLFSTIFKVQSGCIFPVYVAYNSIEIPSLGNFIAGIINITLAISLPIIFNIGLYGVAIAYSTSLFVLHVIVEPIYSAYIIKVNKFTYIKYMILSTIVLIIFVVAGTILTQLIKVDSLFIIIILSSIISVIYLIIFSKLLIKKNELNMIMTCIPEFITKRIPKWLF